MGLSSPIKMSSQNQSNPSQQRGLGAHCWALGEREVIESVILALNVWGHRGLWKSIESYEPSLRKMHCSPPHHQKPISRPWF